MTGFIRTGAYSFVAVDDIKSTRSFRDAAGERQHRLILGSGAEVTVDSTDVDMLLERPIQLIPAATGTALCQLHDDWTVYRVHIIAWALCMDGETRPVTATGVRDCQTSAAPLIVEHPDGSCHEAWFDGVHYDSMDELIAAHKAHREKWPAQTEEGGKRD